MAENSRVQPVILAVPPSVPWDVKSNSEKLDDLTGAALDTLKRVLDTPDELGNLKLMSIKKDAALSVLGAQIKVNEAQLRQQKSDTIFQLLEMARELNSNKLP